MDPHRPAGRPHIPHLLSQPKDAYSEPEQGIILSQGDVSFLLDVVVKQKDASPSMLSCGFEAVSLHLGDRTN
jgi:hypothetical protein